MLKFCKNIREFKKGSNEPTTDETIKRWWVKLSQQDYTDLALKIERTVDNRFSYDGLTTVYGESETFNGCNVSFTSGRSWLNEIECPLWKFHC